MTKYGSPKVDVIYESSTEPPKVQITMTPTVARRILDGHENLTRKMCINIEKALAFIETNNHKESQLDSFYRKVAESDVDINNTL